MYELSEYPLKERNQFALYTIGYEGPVLNQIVKRRHAGTVRFKRTLPVKCRLLVDLRIRWPMAWLMLLTAHHSACLEKLVLRYPFFNGYRKNECQCVLSFQYPMSLLGLDGTLSPERG